MAPISNIDVGAFVAAFPAHQNAGHTGGLDPKFNNQPQWKLFKDEGFTNILVNVGGQALLDEIYNNPHPNMSPQDLMCVLSFTETFNLNADEVRALAHEVAQLPQAQKNPAHVINSAVIKAKTAGENHLQMEVAAVRNNISNTLPNLDKKARNLSIAPRERAACIKQIQQALHHGTEIPRGNKVATSVTTSSGLTIKAAFTRLNDLQNQLRAMPRVNDLNARAEANFAKLGDIAGHRTFNRPAMPPRPKGPGAAPKGPGAGAVVVPPPPPADELEPPAGPLDGVDFDEEFDIAVMEEDSDVSDSEMSDSESEVSDSEEVLPPPAEDIPPPPADVVHPPEIDVPPAPGAAPPPPPPPPQPPKGWKPKAPGVQPAQPKGGAQPAPPKGAPKGPGRPVDEEISREIENRRRHIEDSDSENDDSNNESWED